MVELTKNQLEPLTSLYKKTIQYKILQELNEREKTNMGLVYHILKKRIDEMIKEPYQKNKTVKDLADIVDNNEKIVEFGLSEVQNCGFVDHRYTILKEAKDKKPGKAGLIYFLTDTGKGFYKTVRNSIK